MHSITRREKMSKLHSLTEVTKEEVDSAVCNYRKQRSLDLAEYEKRLQKWRDGYKFSWWQKNVKKLERLDAQDLLVELYGWPSMMGYNIPPCDSVKIELGLWDKSFRYTLGDYGKTWREITISLHLSEKDSHLVTDGVLSWITSWKDHEFE